MCVYCKLVPKGVREDEIEIPIAIEVIRGHLICSSTLAGENGSMKVPNVRYLREHPLSSLVKDRDVIPFEIGRDQIDVSIVVEVGGQQGAHDFRTLENLLQFETGIIFCKGHKGTSLIVNSDDVQVSVAIDVHCRICPVSPVPDRRNIRISHVLPGEGSGIAILDEDAQGISQTCNQVQIPITIHVSRIDL